MITVLLVLVGILVVAGAAGNASKVSRFAAALALLLLILPGALNSCSAALAGSIGDNEMIELGVLVPLAIAGYAFWRGRAASVRRKENRQRRDGHPRQRNLPPPPSGSW